MKKYVFGVDIGGTKTDVGLITLNGSVVEKIRWNTFKVGGWKANITNIIDVINNLHKKHIKKKDRIMGIGIGAPGPMDFEKGMILSPPNMFGWDYVPFVDCLKKKIKLPTIMDNDANAAGLGENIFGAGIGANSLFYFTVSTGIGGGLIIDKKIHHGFTFDAAEIGHMTVNLEGPVCNCGKVGCLEMYSSGTSIARFARQMVRPTFRRRLDSKILKIAGIRENISTKVVAEAAMLGDKTARYVIEQAAYYLGFATSAVIQIVNPEVVVFGGSVMKMGALFLKPLKDSVKKFTWKRPFESCKILRAKLGDDTGVLGAASLVISKTPR
ncbi:hypothetical protein B9J78_03595 [bacterium Unc6]|nr:hypothetical protein [bacterium Unc6]